MVRLLARRFKSRRTRESAGPHAYTALCSAYRHFALHTSMCRTGLTCRVLLRRAIRGLSNYMFHEAQRMAKEEVQQGNDKFDG